MDVFKLLPRLILALAVVACGNGADVAEDPEEIADAAGDEVGPLESEMEVDDLTLGRGVLSDGTVPLDLVDSEFTPGDEIYVSLEVDDATAGSELTVIWRDPDDLEVFKETKTILEGLTHISFQAPDTMTWEMGTYKGEVWYGDDKIDEFEFEVTTPEDALDT